ncbi:hypothetical protein B0T19DRAFT_198582 [Cercophora scortea]|uniref:NACHT domain-containing protein n=1 Tax=Cercophora scortea TaxID=314031 RepID=A0AAE0IDX0_9PEZI|nr:hypothetical protein B0T19DRAFT_198582 [Cercophora scortea]
MATVPWLDDAFREARREFLASVSQRHHRDFSKFGTIDHVYAEIVDIQKKQSKTKTLVALKRIEPFLNGLKDYFGVIDTFSQIQPEIFCLVWGPLKLILQLASSATAIFRKLVAVLEDVGHMLPHFKKYAESGIFDGNDQVKRVMCLFYRDILDLNLEMFKFFQKPSLHTIIDSFWPHFRKKLAVIQDNFESHKKLMVSNVTLEHVLQADDFRRRVLEKFDSEERRSAELQFKTLSDVMSSPGCKSKLQIAVEASSKSSGEWLFQDATFQNWLQGVGSVERCIWIRGIPGAGKTTLTANTIQYLKVKGHVVLFAFLTQDRESFGSPVPILHSLMFQIVEANPDLMSEVHDAYHTGNHSLPAAQDRVRDHFCKIAKISGPLFISIDGVDEISKERRQGLIRILLDIVTACDNVKLLVSCREERDIVKLLENMASSVKVDEGNGADIKEYVEKEGNEWIEELRDLGATEDDFKVINDALVGVRERAKGMFLYAKLVLSIAKARVDLDGILAELSNLPDGLDQAYGRVLSHLRGNEAAMKVLLWIVSAKRPMREHEILQAVLIKPSMSDFQSQRKAWLDIRAACGPIVEVREGVLQLVHFTAKEYLLGTQSGNFLKAHDGHIQAVTVCLTYFLFKSFDPLFSSEFSEKDRETLQQRILSGYFIMFPYATDCWLDHARDLDQVPAADINCVRLIGQTMERFYQERGHDIEDEASFKAIPFLTEFEHFKKNPAAQQSLAKSARFIDRLRYSHIVPKGEFWVDEDPTTLCLATNRFQEALEAMLTGCQEPAHAACTCRKLGDLYGRNLFRCRWIFCPCHTSGFSNAKSRDLHETSHEILRCTEPDCAYTPLGFKTEHDLQAHLNQFHTSSKQVARERSSHNTIPQLRQLPLDQGLAMLEHSVINNDVHLTDSLLKIASEKGSTVDLDMLLQLATWKGSHTMIRFIISEAKKTDGRNLDAPESGSGTQFSGPTATPIVKSYFQNALLLAACIDNVNVARLLLDSGATSGDSAGARPGQIHGEVVNRYPSPRRIDTDYHRTGIYSPVHAAFANMSFEMLKVLVHEYNFEVPSDCLRPAVKRTRGAAAQELFAKQLPLLKAFIPLRAYSAALVVAIDERHVRALRSCLEHGANPNFLTSRGGTVRNPVLCYVMRPSPRKNARDALSMVEILIRSGANPYLRREGSLRGPGSVWDDWAKRMGNRMSWDEVVGNVLDDNDFSIFEHCRRIGSRSRR